MSSYTDGEYRNHMGVTHSSCYKLLTVHIIINEPDLNHY